MMMTAGFRVALAISISAIAVGCSSGPRDAPAATNESPGSDATIEFEVETFDGGTFALGEHRGTPVVINFWESW
jgi:cytochrome oxidase Cu insertion factor (SCO1/SenC/PrrC family)